MKPDDELIRNLMIGLECFFFLLIEDDSFSDKKKLFSERRNKTKQKTVALLKPEFSFQIE